jgi:hypothetical protein
MIRDNKSMGSFFLNAENGKLLTIQSKLYKSIKIAIIITHCIPFYHKAKILKIRGFGNIQIGPASYLKVTRGKFCKVCNQRPALKFAKHLSDFLIERLAQFGCF